MNFNKVEFETAFGTTSQLRESDIPEIVFAGRSNVGKSSLLNKLFNRKALARVSSEPGKTTTINFYRVEDVRLVDLPGYGYAKRSAGEKRRWADLIDMYFQSGRPIKLVVQLIDMRHSPSEDDMIMLNFLIETGYPFIVALTKCDKLKKTEREKQRQSLSEELALIGEREIIETSAENGEGIEKLKDAIENCVAIYYHGHE